MQNTFKELISDIFSEFFKELNWKKQGNNFRFISNDGLGKIINFQKSKWNTSDSLTFYINYGVYMESANKISNTSFKEYDCQFRARTTYLKGVYQIDETTDYSELRSQIMTAIQEAMRFFNKVTNKDAFLKMLLSGEAQQYTGIPVMHYGTCRLLFEMGYDKEIYDIVKSREGACFEGLKKEIEEKMGNQ